MLKKKIAQPVLVTGATGFIGSRVIHKLLQQNISLKVLLLHGELYPAAWIDHMEIIRGSIVDPNAVKKAAAKTKTIIHLAAVVSDWGDEKKILGHYRRGKPLCI